MAQCAVCQSSSPLISRALGVCLRCLREKPQESLPRALVAHEHSRSEFGLPAEPPGEKDGVACRFCVHECRPGAGGMGYCGLPRDEAGRRNVTADQGRLSWYHDPLPTNCVANWVCPGGTGVGYPEHAYCDGPETGYRNLAVFFHACSFDCLFCQNWQFRRETPRPQTRTASELVADVDDRTACICYFGGDPSPQLPFSLRASRLARRRNQGRILRICWETNGSAHPGLVDRMTYLALESGGCIKFDLKAWDVNLHRALTGVTNRRTLENFERVGSRIRQRSVPPLLVASTLLVPGYVDKEEIGCIARFIARIDPRIPYSLLGFYPHYYMSDLPVTSRSESERCLAAARSAGLENVRLGNIHLLQ